MKRFSLLTVAALVMFVAVGCAKPPQEDITAANAEMDKARQAQAQNWAPNEFRAADEAMNAANAEIKAQDEKWFKSYDKAKELLAKAKEDGAKASEAAVANKEQAKKDAEAAMAAADTAIQSAEAALKVAPVTKDSKADLQLFKNDLATLRTTLDGAKASFGSEDYKKALESANSVKDQATSIGTQLEQAKQKKAAAKPAAKTGSKPAAKKK
jgi:hypothetical protein